jgi:hypothetical protein
MDLSKTQLIESVFAEGGELSSCCNHHQALACAVRVACLLQCQAYSWQELLISGTSQPI